MPGYYPLTLIERENGLSIEFNSSLDQEVNRAIAIMSSGGNGTSSDPYYFPGGSQGRITGFGFGVGIFAGILVLVGTITLMSFFCLRTSHDGGDTAPQSRRRRRPEEAAVPDVEAAGLDEETLGSYPKVTHEEAMRATSATRTTASCCSICLADYRDADVVRLLPECGHLFHVDCVDPWLRARAIRRIAVLTKNAWSGSGGQ
ncbi:hypothetical protein ZIOFF_017271 [Zingiber officinale]|uniref:RING-type domain-containing protein n=1 Tax=Zingiber officinale TaxID=94328 RepID=A0A8J5HJ88_ZINOF|nr:hypothetical protein ZIOFF_017271 [Zingiber officinale]